MQQTKKNELVDAGVRLIGLLSVLALLLALISCGPGTGGTGTGPIEKSLTFSGALPPNTMLPVTQCETDCSEWHLALEDDVVELRTACLRFAHTGSWRLEPNRRVADVEGSIELPQMVGMTSTAPATLRLTFSAVPEESNHVTVTLLDADGRTLAGPRSLERSERMAAPAKPGTCPASR
jgi:hypothetical protein